MVDFKKLSAILSCLDDYMVLKGKKEIDDMEANMELERAGLLTDSQPNPGSPLRNLFGSWTIRLSKTMAKFPLVDQFQYC